MLPLKMTSSVKFQVEVRLIDGEELTQIFLGSQSLLEVTKAGKPWETSVT